MFKNLKRVNSKRNWFGLMLGVTFLVLALALSFSPMITKMYENSDTSSSVLDTAENVDALHIITLQLELLITFIFLTVEHRGNKHQVLTVVVLICYFIQIIIHTVQHRK